MLRPPARQAPRFALHQEAPSLARAKRTNRTDARRRHRAEQAAVVAETGSPAGSDTNAARPARASAGTPSPDAAARPGLTTALRGAFRPVDLAGDIRALPQIVTQWGLLASIGIAVAATAVFVLSTNEFASGLDLSLSDPTAGKSIGTVSNLSYLAVSLFVAPPPAAGAFLVGFTAPRASWLGGLIFGLVASACYSVILLSPTGRLLIGGNSPEAYIVNAWAVGPLGAVFFASASAWYKRFLNLANPNRGRRPPAKAAQGRGNAKPNSRVTGRP
jgi:hypothetical protein